MTDIDFKTPSDREWFIQIADALDVAERIYPNVIQMSDELARQIADRLRAISEHRSLKARFISAWRRHMLGVRQCHFRTYQ